MQMAQIKILVYSLYVILRNLWIIEFMYLLKSIDTLSMPHDCKFPLRANLPFDTNLSLFHRIMVRMDVF